ncbi:unnamed protein product [Brassica oleracea]
MEALSSSSLSRLLSFIFTCCDIGVYDDGNFILKLKECDIATMIKATIESLEGQLCSNEVMVRHELGQRISQTAMSDVLRETHFIMLKNTEAKKARCYIKRWCKETGVCEPVTGNVQGTELPEECDDDLLEKTK